MKIGLNLLSLVPQSIGGGETYMRGMLQGLSNVISTDPSLSCIAFTTPEVSASLPQSPHIKYYEVQLETRNRFKRIAWEQIQLPLVSHQLALDALWMPGNQVSLACTVPQVVTIHDLSPLFYWRYFRKYQSSMKFFYLMTMLKIAVRKAAHIIAVSKFTCRELALELGISQKKISVIYEGSPALKDKLDDRRVLEVLEMYGLNEGNYLLSVSMKNKHKNLDKLVEVFAKLHQKGRTNQSLVLIGKPGTGYQDIRSVISQLDNNSNICLIDNFVPHEELIALYQGASCFVMPSLYEGFGLPVLEAMSIGVPVVCANSGSLPEIAGEAALLFDPESVEDMVVKTEFVLNNSKLRRELIDKGYHRVSHFSWNKAATKMLNLFQELVK